MKLKVNISKTINCNMNRGLYEFYEVKFINNT